MAKVMFQVNYVCLLSCILLPAFVHTQDDGDVLERFPRKTIVNVLSLLDQMDVIRAEFQDKYTGEEAGVLSDHTSADAVVQDEGTCVDKMKGCQYYVKYCETHRHKLEGRCDRSCRYCGPPKCVDKRSDCDALKGVRSCKDPEMKDTCPKSCGYCVSCEDSFNPGYCAYLKTFDKCHADLRMQDFCHHTCGFCKLPILHPVSKQNTDVVGTSSLLEELPMERIVQHAEINSEVYVRG